MKKVISITGDGVCPEQYAGKLDTGESFYARYRWGHGRLEVNNIDVAFITDPNDPFRGYFEENELVNLFLQAKIELDPNLL